MNSRTVSDISARLLSKLGKTAAKGTSKNAPAFWLLLGRAAANMSAVSKSHRGNASACGFSSEEDRAPFDKLAEALHQLGIPLNHLRLSSESVPQLRSLLIKQGVSVEQVDRLLKRCTGEDGEIEVDKLIAPLPGVGVAHEPRKHPLVIRAEQRTEVEGVLSELGFPPRVIRRIIRRAVTSGGDLDVKRLTAELRKVDPDLPEKAFVRICRRQGIKVVPQKLTLGKDQEENLSRSKTTPTIQSHAGGNKADARTPLSEEKAGNSPAPLTPEAHSRTDSSDLTAAVDHRHRLELASRLRQEGVQPEQVKKILEDLHGNSQSASPTDAKRAEQNRMTDEEIQTLLSRIQPRTASDKPRSEQRARLHKNVQVFPSQATAKSMDTSTSQNSAEGGATKGAPRDQEAQHKIEQEMAKALLAKQFHSLDGAADRKATAAQGREGFSEQLGLHSTEGVLAAKTQAMSLPTSAQPQTRTASAEPQFQVAQRLVIMTGKGQHRTRLKLHPPELGRVQIEISVQSNNLSASLVTETQAVKELMESHLGQLRQHLAEHNLHLEHFQVTVGTDASPYREQENKAFHKMKRNRRPEVAGATAMDAEEHTVVASQSLGIESGQHIDLFA